MTFKHHTFRDKHKSHKAVKCQARFHVILRISCEISSDVLALVWKIWVLVGRSQPLQKLYNKAWERIAKVVNLWNKVRVGSRHSVFAGWKWTCCKVDGKPRKSWKRLGNIEYGVEHKGWYVLAWSKDFQGLWGWNLWATCFPVTRFKFSLCFS